MSEFRVHVDGEMLNMLSILVLGGTSYHGNHSYR